MPAAARPEPTEAKAALRPRRALIIRWPTRPRLIAAIAGPSTQLAPACKIREAKTIGKNRRDGERERADADSGDGHRRHPALRARGVDDRAAWDLPDQADERADRQDETNIGLSPFFRGQINRDESAKSSLHVRQKEDEPVEAAAARADGMGRAFSLATGAAKAPVSQPRASDFCSAVGLLRNRT